MFTSKFISIVEGDDAVSMESIQTSSSVSGDNVPILAFSKLTTKSVVPIIVPQIPLVSSGHSSKLATVQDSLLPCTFPVKSDSLLSKV